MSQRARDSKNQQKHITSYYRGGGTLIKCIFYVLMCLLIMNRAPGESQKNILCYLAHDDGQFVVKLEEQIIIIITFNVHKACALLLLWLAAVCAIKSCINYFNIDMHELLNRLFADK